LNFTGYSRQKNPVQTKKKSSSSKLIFQTGELQKPGAIDRSNGFQQQSKVENYKWFRIKICNSLVKRTFTKPNGN
jgi:hypothetical protein